MPANRLKEAIRPGKGRKRQDLKPNNGFLRRVANFKIQLANSGYLPFL
jgi:hypothetical protein